MSSRIKASRGMLVAGIAVLLCISNAAFSQTWDEIFRQKKTQRRYLIEQVAALKLYAGYAWKGYKIADEGLRTVHAISNGEFTLHELFFNGLKLASSAITKNPLAAQIVQFQLDISQCSSTLSKVNANGPHKAYITLVRANLARECADDLWELALVLSSARTDLTEDERLVRLNTIHQSMARKRSFVLWFTAQVSQAGGMKELFDSDQTTLNELYEIH